ncbi:hypothetical protein [Streptomyces sp. SS07]|uniref:hypothetical protein n=1 Tax=Streptomyces sp. SS07 TaxID=2015315 RepID=UPI0015C61B9A|nr:hypothetical protein [Streptomyces sp. SS07]
MRRDLHGERGDVSGAVKLGRLRTAREAAREDPEGRDPVLLGGSLLDVEPPVVRGIGEKPPALGLGRGEQTGMASELVREGAADGDGLGVRGRHPGAPVADGERQGVVEQPEGGRPGLRMAVPHDGEQDRRGGHGGGKHGPAVIVHEPATRQERAGVGGLDESRRGGEGAQAGGDAVGLVQVAGAWQVAPVHRVDRLQHHRIVPSRPGGKRVAWHRPRMPR